MTISSLFTTSTQGMLSQSSALDSISNNIANLESGGFKRTDVRFSTVLASTSSDEAQKSSSVVPIISNTIDQQGRISPTGGLLDMAIIGSGFFILNTQLDGSGETFYTRDGNLGIGLGDDISVTGIGGLQITAQEGYLVNKDGFFLQGWAPAQDGTFSNSGSLQSLRVDSFAFSNAGQATTTAKLDLNLPATASPGDVQTRAIQLFDTNGISQTATLNFTKDTVTGQWSLSVTTGDTGDTVLSTPQNITFDGNGKLTSGGSYTVSVDWAGGGSTTVPLDISGFTQQGGSLVAFSYTQNGFGASSMTSVSLDADGQVIANFDDSTNRAIYKIPLALFPNVNGLQSLSGNLFAETLDSGTVRIRAAAETGVATFLPGSLELSNVDLADEFTRMIVAQAAYNASATAFKTMDELLQETAAIVR